MAMEAQAAIMSKRGTPYPADTWPQTSRANASADSSKNVREPSARALAIAIWQRHPSWQGSPGYSQSTHDSCLEFVMPEYANLRLHLFADCRVHITNRRYWDATVVASYETSAYHQRRHRPFFNCAADGLTHTQMADRIDRWLAKYGACYDALVSAESADIEARTRQEQQERASLWVQLLGAIPFNPDAEIQTTHRHSVPKIETAVGKVAISADPDQIELTITLQFRNRFGSAHRSLPVLYSAHAPDVVWSSSDAALSNRSPLDRQHSCHRHLCDRRRAFPANGAS